MNKKFDKKCIRIRNKPFSFMSEYVKLIVFLKKKFDIFSIDQSPETAGKFKQLCSGLQIAQH